MRRDRIDVSIRDPATAQPVLAIDFDGPSAQIADRLAGADGSGITEDELDVTVRYTGEDEGVLALADRVTGTFVLEVEVDVPALLEALGSIREVEDPADRRYRVRVTDASGNTVPFEKRTLLVYDDKGSLSRSESLIPRGVEL
jgi:hypothetical protein